MEKKNSSFSTTIYFHCGKFKIQKMPTCFDVKPPMKCNEYPDEPLVYTTVCNIY